MFALKYRDSSSKGSSQRCHSRQGKELQLLRQKAAIICRRDCAGCWAFCTHLPKSGGVRRHWGQNTAPEKPASKLTFASTKQHPLYLQTNPLISTPCVLGEGLGLLWAAAGGSAPWQQWVSWSHSTAQLWFPPLPGQMPPDRGSGVWQIK